MTFQFQTEFNKLKKNLLKSSFHFNRVQKVIHIIKEAKKENKLSYVYLKEI